MKTLNYYLQERAYTGVTIAEVENSFREIAAMLDNQCNLDFFCMNSNFLSTKWNRKLQMFNLLYDENSKIDNSIRNIVAPYILKRITQSYGPYNNIDEFRKKANTKKGCYFIGAKFPAQQEYEIKKYAEYISNREKFLKENITPKVCEMYLSYLLKRVVLTKEGLENLIYAPYFKATIEYLITLEKYISENWNSGRFDLNGIRLHTSLDITDESDSVKNNPQKLTQRNFYISEELGHKVCLLHIKIGKERIYIYPDNNERKIYVPYVGGHKSTKKY